MSWRQLAWLVKLFLKIAERARLLKVVAAFGNNEKLFLNILVKFSFDNVVIAFRQMEEPTHIIYKAS